MASIGITYELPSDETTERGVLGELLTTGRVSQIEDIATLDTFYYQFHRDIYASIKQLYSEGKMVCYDTVRTDLLKRNIRFAEEQLAYINNSETFDLRGQVAYLNEMATRRHFATCAIDILNKASKIDIPIESLTEIATRMITADDANEQKDTNLKGVMDEAEQIIKANIECGSSSNGTKTGFPFLDERGGLRPGTLTIVGGATSNGKTSFAMTIATNAAKNGDHIGVFSLEMPPVELGQRIIAGESNVENYKIAAKPLAPHDLQSVEDAIYRIRTWEGDLHIDKRKVASVTVILESAARMVRKYGVCGIIVDFLQIIDLGKARRGETEEAMIAEVTRRLKLFALQEGIWVIALSQLNRDGSSEEPDINRMRGSGRIGENADNVMLVYRPEAYPDGGGKYKGRFAGFEHGTAEIIMPKGRNTGIGKYLVAFDDKTTAFKPLTQDDIALLRP